MKKNFVFAGLIVAAMVLSACGGSAEAAQVEIDIEMSEFAYSQNEIQLHVGEVVTLNIVNIGQLEHELMIGRELIKSESGVPKNYHLDMFEFAGIEPIVMMSEMEHGDGHEDEQADAGHGAHSGFMVTLPEGDQITTVTFTVTEEMIGEWGIGCFLMEGSHYNAGMYGLITITS